MNFKNFLLLLLFCVVGTTQAQTDHKLWFNEPANYFEECLVLGNGKLGATVYGGVVTDTIHLNDATLWSGEPVDPYMNPEAYKNIPEIRAALKDENYKLAEELNKKLQGKFSQSYSPLGDVYIHHKAGTTKDYYRELDINTAVSRVDYKVDGNSYSKEYFVSAPDQIFAIKLTSKTKGALAFSVDFDSKLKFKTTVTDKILQINGQAPIRSDPNYASGSIPVVFEDDKGIRFGTRIKIINTDGIISNNNKSITLKNGTEATILIAIATSFNGYDKDPVTNGANYKKIADANLANAAKKSFTTLKENHLKDYQQFFNRVDLNLGKTKAPKLPTDERLLRYAAGKEDKNLEVLYFKYGRYLLISSSRTPGVPANLQGIWNPHLQAPWSSNYTTNINVEENYWLAENTNLSEMHMPLLGLIENISKTGAITAKTFYGVNGWTAAHNSDIWAMSNPVGNFGKGDPSWANWGMSGSWLSTHLWEHYQYTQDLDFLKTKGYPIMKGAALFCLEWLTEDEKGNLITAPSTSPENKYITPDGFIGATMYGGTADLAQIRSCFINAIAAAKKLQIDTAFSKKLEDALAKLHPYKVGKKGNLQEWYHDWEEQDPKHRHQSHLFGLFPGNHITPLKTPELAAACKRTLEIKGDETTGWSKGWRINLWARLWDGNHAYKMYRELLQYVEPDKKPSTKPRRGGTYPNLLDAHPPFQIDGNFGGAAAVAEMLMQSTANEIRLLPALPDVWETGNVKGLCARGGFTIAISWKNMLPKKVTLYSKQGGTTTLIYKDQKIKVTLAKGEEQEIKF